MRAHAREGLVQVLDGLDEMRLPDDDVHVVGLVQGHDLDADRQFGHPRTPFRSTAPAPSCTQGSALGWTNGRIADHRARVATDLEETLAAASPRTALGRADHPVSRR